MNSAAPNRASSETRRDPSYYKAGTIERIMKWRGYSDGRTLHCIAKAIAVALLGYARKDRGYTCMVSETEICADLLLDPKTFRKYLAELVKLGFITVDRNREKGRKRFNCSPLYAYFGEERREPADKVAFLPSAQTGKHSRTDAGQTGKESHSVDAAEREDLPQDRERFPGSPGISPEAVQESFPDSITSSDPSSRSSLSLDDVRALVARWGLSNPENYGTDERRHELALLAQAFVSWRLTSRRQRALIKRYGLVAVMGAVGYVLEQIRLSKDPIERPIGLFQYALERGFDCDIRGAVQISPESAAAPEVNRDHAVFRAACDTLRTRIPEADYQLFVRSAQLMSVDNGEYVIGFPQYLRSAAERLRPALAAALSRIAGYEPGLRFVSYGSSP